MDPEPPYQLSLSATKVADPIPEAILFSVVRETLRRNGCPRACIHVALVDDRRIAELNRRFLDHEGATDVLSFDLRGEDASSFAGAEDAGWVEGELVISVDAAKRESGRRGHALSAELALYAAHGTLHLLGYDDQTPGEARRMHEQADEALEACGLPRIAPKEEA